MSRPPKIYFLAKHAESLAEVKRYVKSVVFLVSTPETEKQCYRDLMLYALRVYRLFH